MSRAAPWSKRCPRGHSSIQWLRTKEVYKCDMCWSRGVDPYYEPEEIRDLAP